MKLVIDIPQEVKEAFDKASKDDINFCFYDYNSVIGKAIKNGTPLDDIKAEFTSCYPKNVYGELELGGRSCVFSLNKVFEILDKHTGKDQRCQR